MRPTFEVPIKNLWEREMHKTKVIMAMESRGVLIDTKLAEEEVAIGRGRLVQIQHELGGFNPASRNDLSELFFNVLGMPLLQEHLTKTGAPSFNKDAMAEYDRMLEARVDQGVDKAARTAKLVLEYRGWQKSVSACYESYLRFLSPDGRLRTNYWLHGTKTGRLSSREPNLQQIPKKAVKRWQSKIKKVFTAKPGFVLLNVDYSQLELRLASAYAGQANWIDVFNTPKDPTTGKFPDVFSAMAADLNKSRDGCKTVTYAKMFGAQANKIAYLLGGPAGEAHRFIKQWESEHADIVALAAEVNRKAANKGYIHYWTGRRRRFDYRSEARKAFNSLIQGGGAEIVTSAMLRLFNEVDSPDCQMLLQVHDAVVFEIRENKLDYYEPVIKEVMSNVQAEKDFGVRFSVESELWGATA